MSETLRDLVVSLSLQTDNFTRNIRSVNVMRSVNFHLLKSLISRIIILAKEASDAKCFKDSDSDGGTE